MSLFYLVQVLLSVWFGLATSYVIFVSCRNYLAKLKFKRKIPNIPFVPGGGLLSGHINELTLSKRNWMKMKDYHQRYGKTFAAMFRDQLMVSTLDLNLIKTFILDEPNDHNIRMNPKYPINEMCQDGILFTDDVPQWQRLRRSMAPAFSLHKVKAPDVQAEINNSIDKLMEAIDYRLDLVKNKTDYAEVDVDDLFHRYALDLVFTCFLKIPNNIDYMADRDFWADAIDSFGRDFTSPLLRFCMLFPIMMPLINWLLYNFHPSGVYRKSLYKYVTEHIATNEKVFQESKKSGDKDFEKLESFTMKDGSKFKRGMVDFFMDRYFNGTITRREYIHSTISLVFAANKSTADTIAKLLYSLSLDERVQNKLRELVLTEGDDCEYISWVIYESLRVITPVYIGCSRTILKDVQSELGVIPAGTFIYTPNFLIHKLKEYWGEDAEEFKPERWAKSKDFHPLQFLAFGAGKRNCLGYMFAMNEIKLLLAKLIKKYKFEKSPKTDPRLLHSSPSLVFIISDQPTYVRISPL